jgi:hypothetical protein
MGWCMIRSTGELAMVLGISSSKPLGCRLELMARERLGRFGGDRERADVVDHDQLGPHGAPDGTPRRVVGRMGAPRASRLNQLTW